MSDHHRSSYYKDSYGSSSSKRYHSPSEASRMNMSSVDYYDSSDSRSKRSRTDNYGAHTTTTRYSDYSASSSSTSGGRYKTTSSSSYYDLPGYKPSSSSASSSSKYLDDYKGSGSSSRSAPKSNMRRIPPPLTPPSLSSKSSSIRLQPLMKVSLSSSSSSGVGSGSSKDYYGSRMRQAPPEHHYSYSGSHGGSSSSYSKPEFKRPLSYGSTKSVSSSSYHSTAPRHSSAVPYRSTQTVASRRLLARSRAPPPSGLASRSRGRGTFMNSRREPPMRRYGLSRKMVTVKHSYKRSRSRSIEKGIKSSIKDKKDEIDTEKGEDKKQPEEDDPMDYVNMTEGQVVVEEVAGDDDDDDDMEQEQDENGHLRDRSNSTDQTGKTDEHQRGDDPTTTEESKVQKNEEDKSGVAEKGSEDHGKATTRALLKLHCPYCDVRCISFREFTFHLRSSGHTRTMHAAVTDMKKKLMKVRLEMKEDQRKREKAEKVLSDTSSYCRVCELSFRTDPKEHEANEIHNKIKTLIYRRCDVCDIDFRIWKVHIYHMAALEHAKRVAMKELQEGDAKGDNVKGTNLSPDELGLDLVEIRTVFYCNACIRYIPIKGDEEEAKRNHCMTLNHLKSVEEYNDRERRRAQREEARERAKRKKQEDEEKDDKIKDANTSGEIEKTTVEGNDGSEDANVDDEKSTQIKQDSGEVERKSDLDTSGGEKSTNEMDKKESEETLANKDQESSRNEADEDDDDEIELHAGEDDVEDESEDTGDWSRRTRSSQRVDGSSN